MVVNAVWISELERSTTRGVTEDSTKAPPAQVALRKSSSAIPHRLKIPPKATAIRAIMGIVTKAPFTSRPAAVRICQAERE